jgi:hypothetical protein
LEAGKRGHTFVIFIFILELRGRGNVGLRMEERSEKYEGFILAIELKISGARNYALP